MRITQEVRTPDLQVDDVILEVLHSDGTWFRWALPATVIAPVAPRPGGGWTVRIHHAGADTQGNWDNELFRVERTRPYYVTLGYPVVNATITVPVETSRWNGKCRLCGRGTYTGFSSVEHEAGPACSAA